MPISDAILSTIKFAYLKTINGKMPSIKPVIIMIILPPPLEKEFNNKADIYVIAVTPNKTNAYLAFHCIYKP